MTSNTAKCASGATDTSSAGGTPFAATCSRCVIARWTHACPCASTTLHPHCSTKACATSAPTAHAGSSAFCAGDVPSQDAMLFSSARIASASPASDARRITSCDLAACSASRTPMRVSSAVSNGASRESANDMEPGAEKPPPTTAAADERPHVLSQPAGSGRGHPHRRLVRDRCRSRRW